METKQRYIKQKEGYKLQVGDIVLGTHAFGTNRYVITHLTAKYAIAKVNDDFQQKFPIEFKFTFSTLPKQKYHTTEYSIFTPIKN